MNIVILGGSNDEFGILDVYTKKRCQESVKCLKNIDEKDVNIHFSGGYDKKFNKANSQISHAILCRDYMKTLINLETFNIVLHEQNNCTVDEAINFCDYFKNSTQSIFFITNDWHMKRVKYLFSKTLKFYNITNVEFISDNSDNIELTKEDEGKIEQLINKPYGRWKKWLVSNYYEKFVSLKLIEKNDTDGKIIVNMRNENNKYFFNTEKFYWKSFKNIFYEKYFINEIPPFFIILDDNIVGFIGCKTTDKNINDIGIMMFQKYQGKGLGKISLKKFITIFNEKYNKKKEKTIVSQILKTNIGSYKIFIDNNFKLNENKSKQKYFYLTYN